MVWLALVNEVKKKPNTKSRHDFWDRFLQKLNYETSQFGTVFLFLIVVLNCLCRKRLARKNQEKIAYALKSRMKPTLNVLH